VACRGEVHSALLKFGEINKERVLDLSSKIAVITGSAANIGRSIALLFARNGAKVVITSRRNTQGGDKVVEEIAQGGGEAIFVQADLSREKEVTRLFDRTVDHFGGLDILVNNAGSATPMPFLESTKEHWLSSFDDNFFSCVLCSVRAARIMREGQGGKIINTSSIRGISHTGREGIMAYSAAKAAMINFTKTLAKELAPEILVNAVAPGFVLTPNYDDVPQKVKDEFIDGTLINRWISSDEIAEAFLYLAGADGITGEVLVVDGGFTLKQ
jgi:3-oxoacyl-[acyl-carrier protein] reductase